MAGHWTEAGSRMELPGLLTEGRVPDPNWEGAGGAGHVPRPAGNASGGFLLGETLVSMVMYIFHMFPVFRRDHSYVLLSILHEQHQI